MNPLSYGVILSPRKEQATRSECFIAKKASSMKNPERLGRFAETALVLVRFDHITRFIDYANHSIV